MPKFGKIWLALPFQWDMLTSVQIYRLLRVCAQLILSILLVKSGIATEEIGRFEMLLYLAMVLSFFWVNPLLNALLPSYSVHDDKDERLTLSKGLFFILTFGSVALALFFFFGQSFLVPLLTGRTELPYLALICIYFVFEFPSYLGEYYYIIREKSKPLQYLGWLSYGLFILISAVILFTGGGIKELLYCMIGISVFRYVWVLVVMIGIKGLQLKSSYLSAFLKNSGALALYSILGSITLLFDQWLVGQRFDDESAFAIFRYGARQLPFVTTLLAGFATVFTFQIAQRGFEELEEMKARALKYYHFIFPLIIILIPLAHYLYRIFYSEAFDLSASIFNIYLLVLCSRMVFTGIIFLARKLTMVMVTISIIELCINIGLSLYLVQFYGLLGIAAATVIAYYFERLAHMIYLYFKMGLRPKEYFPVKAYVIYSALAWGIFFIVEIL